MGDDYDTYAAGLESPATKAAEITPSDLLDLESVTRAVYIGGSGNLRVTMVGGQTVTFAGVPTGVLPIRVARVHATGTTATGLVGLR